MTNNRYRLMLAIAATCLIARPAAAQSPLRWKLSEGEQLVILVEQHTTSDVSFSGKQLSTTIDLKLDMLWEVTAVKPGEIELKQTIRQIQLKLQPAGAAALEYDSASKAWPAAQARDLATAISPLIGAELSVTMNGRGAIQEVKAANEAAEQLLAGESAAGRAAFSKAHLRQLLGQSLIIFPEKSVAEGDSWTSDTNLTAALGEFKRQTTYTLAGLEEREGTSLAKIESTTKLEPVAPQGGGTAAKPAAAPKVKSHEQTGTILFDPESGKLVEANETQELVTERPYRDTTIVVSLKSEQKTTLKAAKE
jgi:hypothetical protein